MFFKKMYDFILDENEVIKTIGILNGVRLGAIDSIGNCGWANEPNKFFIFASLSKKEYRKFKEEINKHGLNVRQRVVRKEHVEIAL